MGAAESMGKSDGEDDVDISASVVKAESVSRPRPRPRPPALSSQASAQIIKSPSVARAAGRCASTGAITRSMHSAKKLPKESSLHYCEPAAKTCKETSDACRNDLMLCKWSAEEGKCVRRTRKKYSSIKGAVQRALDEEIRKLDSELSQPPGSDIRVVLKENLADVSILAAVSERPAEVTDDKYLEIFKKVIDFCIDPSPEMCTDPLSSTAELCVSHEYISSHLLESKYIVLLLVDVSEHACKKEGPGGDIRSFISIEMQNNNRRMYINLICAKRTNAFDKLYYQVVSGKVLLKLAEAYASTRFSELREIELEVIPSTMLYYPRLGFQYRKTCSSDDKDLINVPAELMSIAAKDLRNPENVDRIQAFEDELIRRGNGVEGGRGPHMKKCLK